MVNQNSALVVYSGGQDSTTCLYWAIEKFGSVSTVSFDYGQRHKQELQCAADICKEAGVSNKLIDLSLLNALAPNALTRTDIEMEKQVVPGCLPNTFVDGRNMVFLSFAAIYAKQLGINNLVTGVSQADFSGYPDCRDVFIKSMNVTLNLAMDYEFVIYTPLMWISKAETWKMAHDLGVLDIIKEKTLTCYNGIVGKGCGNCPACGLRNKGYDEFLSNYPHCTPQIKKQF